MRLSRRECILAAASLAGSVLFFVLFMAHFGEQWYTTGGNQDYYWTLAQNLHDHGAFSLRTEPPYTPTGLTTPLYPLILSAIAVPFHSAYPAIVLNFLLFAAAAVLLYRTMKEVFDERVACFSALVFGIEPWNVFSVNFANTEALFLFLLVSSLFLLRKALAEGRERLFFVSGLVLGAAGMTRPVAVYLPLLIAVFILWYRRSSGGFVRSLRFAGVLLAGCLLVFTPWLARNWEVFHAVSLSAKGPYTVYFYDVAELVKYRDHISAQESFERLFGDVQQRAAEISEPQELFNPAYGSLLNTLSFNQIMSSPFLFAKLHLVALGTFFVSDGYRLLLQYFGALSGTMPNITSLVASGNVVAVWEYLRSDPLAGSVFVLGALFWGLVTLAAFAALPLALWREERRERRFFIGLFVALMLYFALLTGLAALARYRVQITPFLFPLAAYSVSVILRRYD